jgi:hypothetical protein
MFAAVSPALAQNPAAHKTVVLASGLEATVIISVPEEFEPDTATDQELLDYGYPRRPDASDASALALWRYAVHTTRIDTDLVEKPGIVHRPAQELSTKQTNGLETGTSGNWSAVVLDGASADFTHVVGFWAVPNVSSQVAGTGNGYSSMWIGLDGSGTKDLIQDGTASDWIGGKAVYNAWVEVLPSAEVELSGLVISPGDAIYATTAYVVTSGKAHAAFYISNLNTKKSVSTSIAFPTTLKFTGQSAEWVVERTDVNGSFEHPMPRYGIAFMSAAYAERGSSTTLIPACSPYLGFANLEYLTMYDTPTKEKLSAPVTQGPDAITFEWLNY